MMRTLLGEWKPRALLCRVFGHWWRAWHSDYSSGCLYGRYCHNCDALMMSQRWIAPRRPPSPAKEA